VVDANLCCLETEQKKEMVFNVACGKPNTVNNLFVQLAKILDSSIKPVYLPARKGDVFKTHADISRLKKLGWTPKVNFQQGLAATVEWFRSQAV
jgi:nucleoside-diphosphate-sugar epimerase